MSQKTYYVKYKSQLLAATASESKAKAKTPKVEAPKVEAPRAIKPDPEPEILPPPRAEREVVVLRHLADIYKALNQLAEHQDALIGVFRTTLADLAETKEELERERQRRNWWDKVKGLFS